MTGHSPGIALFVIQESNLGQGTPGLAAQTSPVWGSMESSTRNQQKDSCPGEWESDTQAVVSPVTRGLSRQGFFWRTDTDI